MRTKILSAVTTSDDDDVARGEAMLAFSDEQIVQIRTAATRVPWRMRETFLQRIATLLDGRPFGNGDVQRAAAQVQRELIGITDPE